MFRFATAGAFKRQAPARPGQAGDAQLLAGCRPDAPSRHRSRAVRLHFRCQIAPKHEGRHARLFSRELKAPGCGQRHLAKFAHHATKPCVTKALLHGDQHVRIAFRFDENDAIRVKSGEMQSRREKVAPVHAPEDRALGARQYPSQKNRGCRIIGKLQAPRHFVQRPGRNPAAWQMTVDCLNAERKSRMGGGHALDLRDTRAQI